MAKIVLGIATSHGPLLVMPPEQWSHRVEADKRHPGHPYRDGTYKFDELVELRAGEGLDKQIGLEVRQKRFDACQTAIAKLADLFTAAKPDIAVIIGNDQMEIFADANLPAMMVYFGETIENVPFNAEQLKRLPPGIAISEPNHHGPTAETYPGQPELARHLIATLIDRDFDIATSKSLPSVPTSNSTGIPHAFGFVYRRIMQDRLVPSVPVFVNGYYPPNQPKTARCLALGKVLAQAIAGWDRDLRVAVIGSGGMSHFVVDEEFDHRFLAAFQKRDTASLVALPEFYYRSGTSELKNWIPLYGAMLETGLAMNLIDYVPCYRSPAGTGSGMGFAYWQ
jgi:hypothetical protein